MNNFPGTDVNIVGKDMPIAHISTSIVPLMPAANDERTRGIVDNMRQPVHFVYVYYII